MSFRNQLIDRKWKKDNYQNKGKYQKLDRKSSAEMRINKNLKFI